MQTMQNIKNMQKTPTMQNMLNEMEEQREIMKKQFEQEMESLKVKFEPDYEGKLLLKPYQCH